MDADGDLLERTASRIFADHAQPARLAAAEQGEFLSAAWQDIEAAGLPRALVPEAAGGFGLGIAEALELLRVAGAHALPLPLAETMLACRLLAAGRLEIPDGPLSIAPVLPDDVLTLRRENGGYRLTGTARRVPWGRHVGAVVVLATLDGVPAVAMAPADGWQVAPSCNLAREPRDSLRFDQLVPADAVAPLPNSAPSELRALGAAMRSLQMAGALGRLVEMSARYAGERVQFGRAIGKFQAVQQNMAMLAAASAAAGAAATAAAAAVADGMRMLPIAAAKVRTGEAAGLGAAIAHQVHGAIGFTYEHSLHFLTKRLWSWRDEFGSETEWSLLIGRAMLAAGPDRLWPAITAA